MTRQEMINLLGLKPNYTENELKKAYRKLAKDNHPDLYPGDKAKEEIFKKIGIAYEELLKEFGRIKNQGGYFCEDDYTQEISFETFVNDLIKKIEKKLRFDKVKYADFTNCYESVVSAFRNLAIQLLKLGTSKDREEIKAEYDKFLNEYEKKLREFLSKYYKDNYIDANEVKETIDYTANLNDFFAKLLEINKKYSKEPQYINKIKASVNEYLNNPLYAALKDMILAQLNRRLSLAKISKYKNLDNIIAQLVSNVEMLIKQYEKDLKRINAIREDLKELYGSDIIDMVLGYKDNEDVTNSLISSRGISRDEIQMIIELDKMEQSPSTINDSLLDGFEKIINDRKDSRKRIEVIKPIHDAIEEKFKSCLLSHFGTSVETQKSVIDIYNKYLEFYKLACKGEISLEDYKKLESLTFTDFEKDNSLLQNLCSKKEEKVDNNNELDENPRKVIYVRKGRDNCKPYETFGYLVTSGEDMYMITISYMGNIISSKITKEELEANYVTFDEFMKNMTFDGKRSSHLAVPYIVLYINETNEYVVTLDDKTGEINIDIMYYHRHRYGEGKAAKISLPYENKDRLALAILEMIKKRLRSYNRSIKFDEELHPLDHDNIINKFDEELILNFKDNNRKGIKF